MHSALIHVALPPFGHEKIWLSFLSSIESIEKSESVSKLAENVYMIETKYDLISMAKIIYFCDSFGLNYEVLAFDSTPQWLPHSP